MAGDLRISRDSMLHRKLYPMCMLPVQENKKKTDAGKRDSNLFLLLLPWYLGRSDVTTLM
jgi:hypothetical protein